MKLLASRSNSTRVDHPAQHIRTHRRVKTDKRTSRRAVYWHMPWSVGVALIVLIVGITVLAYPTAAQWQSQYIQSQQIHTYNENISRAVPDAATQLKAAHAYNKALQSSAIYRSNTNIPIGQGKGNIQQFNYNSLLTTGSNSPMARLQIPHIHLDLPIFHGTSDKTLLEGLGHLEGTSLPVGGVGTRSVITGHRGLAEAQMFTRLNEVRKGDMFFIQVMGKVLQYKVVQIQIIEPEDTQALKPDPKRDLVTLVTCTPLGINTQRILVTGERYFPVDETSAKNAQGDPHIPYFPWFALAYGAAVIAILGYAWMASRHRLPLPVIAGSRSWYFRRRDTVRAILGADDFVPQAGSWTMVVGPRRAGISTLLSVLIPQAYQPVVSIDITQRSQVKLRNGRKLIAYINRELARISRVNHMSYASQMSRVGHVTIDEALSTSGADDVQQSDAVESLVPVVIIHGLRYVTHIQYVIDHMPHNVAVVTDVHPRVRRMQKAASMMQLRIIPVGALSFAEWAIDMPSMQQYVDAERGIVLGQNHADADSLKRLRQLWEEYMQFGGYPELADMAYKHRYEWLVSTAKRIERLCKRCFTRIATAAGDVPYCESIESGGSSQSADGCQSVDSSQPTGAAQSGDAPRSAVRGRTSAAYYQSRPRKPQHITAVTVQNTDRIGLRDAGIAHVLGITTELCMYWNVMDTCDAQGVAQSIAQSITIDYQAQMVTCPASMLEQQALQGLHIPSADAMVTLPIWQFCIQRPYIE